jgi:hypothetical protein
MQKPIPFFESYTIDENSVIRNSRGVVKATFPTCNGRYRGVHLYRDGKRTTFNVHQLVMLTFFGDTPLGCVIDHVNDNRLDNRLENLQFLSPQQNVVKYYASAGWKIKREIKRMDTHIYSMNRDSNA